MKYQLAIFDLDGTLLNTLEDLTDSVNHALSVHNMPARTLAEVRSFVGNGILNLIKRAVPHGTSDSEIQSAFETFHAHYKIHSADKTCPYDGVIPMLEMLKNSGVKLAVHSNKADYAVQDLCTKYFSGIFDAVAGEKQGVQKKPSPDGVNAILEEIGIERKSAVYIGDSDVDVQTAKNAEIPCISVDWGFRDRDILEKAGAEIIVSSPQKVAELVVEE